MINDAHVQCHPLDKPVPGHDDNPPCPLNMTTVPELIDCMNRTLTWSGMSLRRVATRAAGYGCLPRSTMSYMLKHRKTVPSEEQLRAFVFACRIGNHWENWRITREVIERKTGRSRS